MVFNSTVEDIFPDIKEDSTNETIARQAAVLKAVTDTIKAKNAPIQPISYFALILATLNDNNYKDNQKSDLLKLLSIVILRVSNQVVRTNGDQLIDMITKILEVDWLRDDVVSSAVNILGHVLTHSEGSSWQTADRIIAYNILLKSAVDGRSKIRQKALKQIILVLNSGGASGPRGGIIKPIATVTTQFCHDLFVNTTLETMQQSYHALSITHEMIPLLPPPLIASLMDDIIKMTTLGNAAIAPSCYKTIGTLFFRTNQLVAVHVQQLIDVLLQYPPSGIDLRSTIAYTELLTHAFQHFSRLDRVLCNQHLHKYFDHLLANFSSDKQEITNVTRDGFRQVIYECINEDMINQAIAIQQTATESGTKPVSPLHRIIDCMSRSLTHTYMHSWELILPLIGCLFEQLGPSSFPLLNDILKTVDAFETMRPSVERLLMTALVAIGARNLLILLPLNLDAHPEDKTRPNRGFLLPLMKKHLKFSELQAFIDYFLPMTKVLKTKADECREDGKLVHAKNLEILHKQVWQLLPGFCTLPIDGDKAFKGIARTLGSALQDNVGLRVIICQTLSVMITNLCKARDHVDPGALPLRIKHVTMSKNKAEDTIKSVAVFAKNYLPILFNIFPASNKDHRQYITEAIEAYLSIADEELIQSLFKNILTKLIEAQTADEEALTKRVSMEEKIKSKQYYLTELLMGFIKHLDEESLNTLYKTIRPQFTSADNGIKKRSFKLLEKICSCQPTFILANLEKLKVSISYQLIQSTSNLKKVRINILKMVTNAILEHGRQIKEQILHKQEEMFTNDFDQVEGDGEDNEDAKSTTSIKTTSTPIFGSQSNTRFSWTQLRTKFIPSILPDVVMCTKEINAKCKENAIELVVELGEVMTMIGERTAVAKRNVNEEDSIRENQIELLKEYLQLMAAGLASITPMMVSATIVSMSRVIHFFKELVSEDLAITMLSTLLVLLDSPHREVVKSVMGFTRITLARFKEPQVIEPFLSTLINAFAKLSVFDKNYFRVMIGIIVQRLIKRFNYETIHQLAPTDQFKNILTHINRKIKRSEKKKEEKQNGEGMDTNTDDAASTRSKKSTKSAKSAGDDNYDDSDSEIIDNASDDDNDQDIEEFLFNVKPSKVAAAEAGNSWIMQKGDEPIDFLDRSAINHIASNPQGKVRVKRPTSAVQDDAFEFDHDGKMIIEEDEEEQNKKLNDKQQQELKRRDRRKRAVDTMIENVFDQGAEQYERRAGYHAIKQKGKNKSSNDGEDFDDDDDDDMVDDTKSAFTKKTFQTGKTKFTTKSLAKSTMTKITRITGATDRYNRTRGVQTNVNLERTTSQQQKGDTKKSTLQPYAYIPLDPKALNKRTKHIGQFSKKK